MKSVTVYKHDGSEAGKVELPDNIFGIEPSLAALHQVIKAYLANQRQGNASTKTRSEVDVTKSKPFRQKGTGRARAGSANSPLWPGGGTAFGPKPRSYTEKVNKKVRRLGLKSAYSMKARGDGIVVVEDFELTAPKTKSVADVFKVLGIAGKKVLFIVPGVDANLLKSSRNILNCVTEAALNANAYDVTNADVLLMTRSSVDKVKESFQHEKL
jgi:large subunit ribosomal protein L4